MFTHPVWTCLKRNCSLFYMRWLLVSWCFLQVYYCVLLFSHDAIYFDAIRNIRKCRFKSKKSKISGNKFEILLPFSMKSKLFVVAMFSSYIIFQHYPQQTIIWINDNYLFPFSAFFFYLLGMMWFHYTVHFTDWFYSLSNIQHVRQCNSLLC